MRTAEEILRPLFEHYTLTQRCQQRFIDAINEARKEALEEAAKKANLNIQCGYGTLDHKGTCEVVTKDKIERTSYGHGDATYEVITVNKQSILSIIQELK